MQPPIPVAALRWLELSGRAERGLIVLGALIVLAIVVASIRGRRRPVPAIPPIPQRQELVLLLGIVVLAALLRTLFATSEHQPRLFFPESGVMDAATLLAKGGLWDRWKTVLSSTQVNWPQESAVMVPVNALAVATLGPSLELPQYIGSLCGVPRRRAGLARRAGGRVAGVRPRVRGTGSRLPVADHLGTPRRAAYRGGSTHAPRPLARPSRRLAQERRAGAPRRCGRVDVGL